jgi:hypothetical protein
VPLSKSKFPVLRAVRVAPVSAIDEFSWLDYFSKISNRYFDVLRSKKFGIGTFNEMSFFISFAQGDLSIVPREQEKILPWMKTVDVTLPTELQDEQPSEEVVLSVIRQILVCVAQQTGAETALVDQAYDEQLSKGENFELVLLEKNTKAFEVLLYYKYDCPNPAVVSFYVRVKNKKNQKVKEVLIGKLVREVMKACVGSVVIMNNTLIIKPRTSGTATIFLALGHTYGLVVPIEIELGFLSQ